MTPQQKQIAVAKLDGYTPYPKDKDYWMPKSFKLDHSPYSLLKTIDQFQYLTSHDVIISVIEKQTATVIESVIHNLTDYRLSWFEQCKLYILATPEQLVDALLRATNNWKD